LSKDGEFHPYAVDRKIMGEMLTVYQQILAFPARAAFAQGYATTVNDVLARTGVRIDNEAARSAEIAASLKILGIAEIGPLLGTAQIDEIVAHFRALPVHPSHTAGTAMAPPGPLSEIRSQSHYGAYSLDRVLSAPHLLEIANDPLLVGAASKYLGCVPTLYSVNCWWTFGGHETKAAVAHNFHRDPDDIKFCTLFIYLTDVTEDASSHEYVASSHNPPRFEADMIERGAKAGLDKAQAQALVRLTYEQDGNIPEVDGIVATYLGDRIRRVHGPAGFAMLEDTFGLHRGTPHPKTDRLMFWARYGLGLNQGFLLGRHEPARFDWRRRLTDSPLTRYVNRLIIDTD
jgi:hypothetical protein